MARHCGWNTTGISFDWGGARVIQLLDECSSVSSGITKKLRIDRSVARELPRILSHTRALQVSFCSIICATRFKFFSRGALLPAVYQRCVEVDNLSRILGCTQMGEAPETGSNNAGETREELIAF